MSFVDKILFLASIGAACAIVFGVALVTSSIIEEHGAPGAVIMHIAGAHPEHANPS